VAIPDLPQVLIHAEEPTDIAGLILWLHRMANPTDSPAAHVTRATAPSTDTQPTSRLRLACSYSARSPPMMPSPSQTPSPPTACRRGGGVGRGRAHCSRP
jgi:hypothetical protein